MTVRDTTGDMGWIARKSNANGDGAAKSISAKALRERSTGTARIRIGSGKSKTPLTSLTTTACIRGVMKFSPALVHDRLATDETLEKTVTPSTFRPPENSP